MRQFWGNQFDFNDRNDFVEEPLQRLAVERAPGRAAAGGVRLRRCELVQPLERVDARRFSGHFF